MLVGRFAQNRHLGRNIFVAWNGSTEQAHTNAFALPLLEIAEQVIVLTVEGATTVGPSGQMAALHLRRNGINAVELSLKPGTRTTGEVLLEHAASLGCDLLVKRRAAPLEPDDIRRCNATHHCSCHLAGPDGALINNAGSDPSTVDIVESARTKPKPRSFRGRKIAGLPHRLPLDHAADVPGGDGSNDRRYGTARDRARSSARHGSSSPI